MSLKVLIIDDSPVIPNLLQKAFDKEQYEVCGIAKNGKEGMEIFDAQKPDIVFTDISMPIMDGLEVAKQIKYLRPSTKIIMMSAMGDEEIIKKAEALGINIFLKKPFDDYKIVSALSKL